MCIEVTTTEVFGYSEAERCKRIDAVGDIYKNKVNLLNGAAQKMMGALKAEEDPAKKQNIQMKVMDILDKGEDFKRRALSYIALKDNKW